MITKEDFKTFWPILLLMGIAVVGTAYMCVDIFIKLSNDWGVGMAVITFVMVISAALIMSKTHAYN